MSETERQATQETEAQSVDGRGIVVCLAKFSEHLHEHGPYSEKLIREYAKWTPEERAHCQAQAAKFPRGDSAQKLRRMEAGEFAGWDRDEKISYMIEIWMYAASEHFYGLADKAPEPLQELASLTLRIGHGFTSEIWTIETVDRIRELWRESCLAVDRMLGVEPDWGS